MPFQSTAPANSWQPLSGWSVTAPAADEPGSLLEQISALIYFATQTDCSQSLDARMNHHATPGLRGGG